MVVQNFAVVLGEQRPFGGQRAGLLKGDIGKVFIAFKVEQCCLQQRMLLRHLTVTQVVQLVLVDVRYLTEPFAPGVFQQRLGELGDALEAVESLGQPLVGAATGQLAVGECLAQPLGRVTEPGRWCILGDAPGQQARLQASDVRSRAAGNPAGQAVLDQCGV